MRVHHLNCGTLCPPARLVGRMVCHCLAIETEAGVVLVDTGMGDEDVRDPARLGRDFLFFTGARLDAAETMRAQLEGLGIGRDDVRHIVLTHLDLDHAGGLSDFRRAKVHVHEVELAAARARRTLNEKRRYKPRQWAHDPDWAPLPVGGERWHGFEGVNKLPGIAPELLLVPLYGHTRGHCGVAVRAPEGWLLHAGDAYFNHGEVEPEPHCPLGLQLFQWLMQLDGTARLANQSRLRGLANDATSGVRVFCSHDARELEQLPVTAARPSAA
jgi:glyoxylase-like metal-dependent hydrolase (beta-lactamase superfamily II)